MRCNNISSMNKIIKELVEKNSNEAIAFLADLIAQESLSGKENEAAKVVYNYFSNSNIPCFSDERGSIIAAFSPSISKDANDNIDLLRENLKKLKSEGKKIIAFSGHLDVVMAKKDDGWDVEPFKLTEIDQKLIGRGTCDMKGAVSAMANAIKLYSENPELHNPEIVVLGCFITEEEVAEGLAFKELIEWLEVKPDWVILGEPSQMGIARGQRGKLCFKVITQGTKAHTSVPEVGVNAAYSIAKVLLAIEEFENYERAKYGLEEKNMLLRTTIVATNIRTLPKENNFVPDYAECNVTARLAKNSSFKVVSERLKKSKYWPVNAKLVLSKYEGKSYKGKKSPWHAEHPAWETCMHNDFFQQVFYAYTSYFNKEPKVKIWPFSTDGVYSAGIENIPTLGIGPGFENVAHKSNEWIYKEDYFKAIEFYINLMHGLKAKYNS